MATHQLLALAIQARTLMADPARSIVIGNDANPRFELFHAASSLCSQKVRTVLAEKQLSYRSNEMMILSSMSDDIFVPAEHYHPPYVRLRLMAGREIDKPFVNSYSGRTSVETEGFDPCVVPLLVDYEAGRVIADSMRICCYLDEISATPVRLVPEAEKTRAAVMHQATIVDRIPNGGLLYGFHPDADRRPEALRTMMQTVYDYKMMALESMIAANATDMELVSAYRAKIIKERGGKSVCHDAGFQRAIREQVAGLLRQLNRTLTSGISPWVVGNSFTLGDVMWGVNLTRLAYLGLASMWEELPAVSLYVDTLIQRASLRQEAIQATIDSLPYSAYLDTLIKRAEHL
ncbi:GST C-terminal domain-containing protein [Bordetella tumbae]|uniref:glutathione S-transferase family protein n=1 Tax=Bordetella tumbae TaxID=1649139 RepID=UPI0039EEAF32